MISRGTPGIAAAMLPDSRCCSAPRMRNSAATWLQFVVAVAVVAGVRVAADLQRRLLLGRPLDVAVEGVRLVAGIRALRRVEAYGASAWQVFLALFGAWSGRLS